MACCPHPRNDHRYVPELGRWECRGLVGERPLLRPCPCRADQGPPPRSSPGLSSEVE